MADGPTATAPADLAPNERITRGFRTRERPVFDDVSDERRYRLQRMAGACRILGRMGLADGLLGHITVRDPEEPHHFWVNPLGVSFTHIDVPSLVRVDEHGEIVEGHHPVNPVGLLLHAAVHRTRPEVEAVCHAHADHGRTWATLGRLLDPISQDACVFFERQALIVEPRVAFDTESADEFARQFGAALVAIQEGHGVFTTGQSVDEAAWWFIQVERACRTQLMAEAVGTPKRWPDASARGIARSIGSPSFGWASFQPLWDEILAAHPELVG